MWNGVTGLPKKVKTKALTQAYVYEQLIENPVLNTINRLMKKTRVEENGCHTWLGATSLGYGVTAVLSTTVYLHRIAWVIANQSQIQPGFVIRHGQFCKTTCFNAAHLQVGTRTDNAADRIRDGTSRCGAQISKKLNDEMVIAIIDSYGTDTKKNRAKKFGVSYGVILQLDANETWRHIVRPTREVNRRFISNDKAITVIESKGSGTRLDRANRLGITSNAIKFIDNHRSFKHLQSQQI